MFTIGDKVVYPMHGAGTIESIEEREILGEKKQYYVMKMPIGDMKVMIPIANVDAIGLREVIDHDELETVIEILAGTRTNMSANWNRRFRANMEKIKTGNIHEVAEVVRNLTLREGEKGLSTGERKMLENAKQILISEIVLVKEIDKEEVEKIINGIAQQGVS
jgi:CarD family transcriptional regulator